MVLTPANPKAQILSAKNEDGTINIKNLDKALAVAGLSRNERRLVLSGKARELQEALRVETAKEQLISKLKL